MDGLANPAALGSGLMDLEARWKLYSSRDPVEPLEVNDPRYVELDLGGGFATKGRPGLRRQPCT